MLKLGIASFLSLITVVAVSGPGCDDAVESFHCDEICDRYRDCFNADFDSGACQSACENESDNSDAFSNQAQDCENCLDDRTCGGSFACSFECAGVIIDG